MLYLWHVGQPTVVLSLTDGQLLVVASESDAVTELTCSDMAGVPTPSFNWTYADNPITSIMIIIFNICYSL